MTEDYDVPSFCPSCLEDDYRIRIITKGENIFQVRFQCNACRHSFSIPKLRNLENRTSTTLAHWAMRVKKRDGYTCRVCGGKTGIHAHHIVPVSVDPSLMYTENNGITLCAECHKKTHKSDISGSRRSDDERQADT